jgi:hypothetical protein
LNGSFWGPIWERCEERICVNALPVRLPNVGRSQKQRAPRFSESGVGSAELNFYFCVDPRRRASGGRTVTCRCWTRSRGPGGRGAGRGGEGPSRPPSAPLGPASASREAAWRPGAAAAAAPPAHAPLSKWLKPQALGGRREPLPSMSCSRAALPHGNRGDRRRCDDSLHAWNRPRAEEGEMGVFKLGGPSIGGQGGAGR